MPEPNDAGPEPNDAGPEPTDAGPEPTDRVTGAIATLFRLEGSRRLHRQQSAAAGVDLSQLGLRLLGRIIDGGPASPGQLAILMDLDPAVVARLLRQLEDGGFVRRERSPEDGRVSTMHATAEGLDAFARMREVIWRHMRRVLAGWPAPDVDALAALLERLVNDVQQMPYPTLAPEPAGSQPRRRL